MVNMVLPFPWGLAMAERSDNDDTTIPNACID